MSSNLVSWWCAWILSSTFIWRTKKENYWITISYLRIYLCSYCIKWGHLFIRGALGYPKHPAFNGKNLVHFWWYDVVKDIKNYLREHCYPFLALLGKFVCFPKFWVPTNDIRRHRKLGQKSKISPKSLKINKCWFFEKFHRQFSGTMLRVHLVSISSKTNKNSWFYDLLKRINEKKFWLFFIFSIFKGIPLKKHVKKKKKKKKKIFK